MAGFTIEVTVSAGDLAFTLPATDNGTFNATVYWGDTTQSVITTYDDADLTHTYSGAGTYEVEIQGAFPGFSFNNGGDKDKCTDIVDWGNAADFDGFQDLDGGFYGSAIASLGTGEIQSDGLTTLQSVFFSTSITAIPSGLFDNCTDVTSFYACFFNSSLTAISSGLFDYCTDVYSFYACFFNNSLTAIPSGLFDYCTGVNKFGHCFYGNSITAIPSGLFAYCTAANDFGHCFSNNFNVQIPSDLFYAEGEQDTRFLNKTISFSNCFYRESFAGSQGTAPDLWNCDFGTGSPTSLNCFAGAGNSSTSLDNYKNIPTAWGGSAVSDPAITDIDTDEEITTDQENVILAGTDLLPYQYDGVLELSDSATYGAGTVVEQSVDSWSDTSIQFDVVPGGLSDGTVYAWITTDRGDYNATGFAVTLSAASGWTNIAKVNDIAQANIAAINGVAKANISKINGVSV